MQQVPILILSDCPSQSSGLARITRDLATLLSSIPEFRVATLGMQGTGSSRLPFHTYHLFSNEFGELSLPMCWDEFSQGQAGILLSIWDLSRLMWLARPEFCEQEDTREWLFDARRRKLRLWSYVPVDSTGPHNRLTTYSREVLLGIDRIIAYSPWGMGIIRNTIGEEEAVRRGLDWAPHGINTKTFTPIAIANNVTRVNTCTRKEVMPNESIESIQPPTCEVEGGHGASEETSDDARETTVVNGRNGIVPIEEIDIAELKRLYPQPNEAIVDIGPQGDGQAADNVVVMPSVAGGTDGIDANVKRIGIVMTNQARKDWGLAAATCAGIVERLKGEVQFWWHTQLRQHVWNLDALIADFQLGEYVEVTTQPVSDGWLAEQYRRCDLTLLPSLGEGLGYPLFESLACGVPVIHGDYAGGASIMSTCGLARYLVQPIAWRLEGAHNCLRPVYEPADWVNAACDVLAIKPDAQWLVGRVAHLSWMKLGHVWQRWFREGLGDDRASM